MTLSDLKVTLGQNRTQGESFKERGLITVCISYSDNDQCSSFERELNVKSTKEISDVLVLPMSWIKRDGSRLVNITPVQHSTHRSIQVGNFNSVGFRVGPV